MINDSNIIYNTTMFAPSGSPIGIKITLNPDLYLGITLYTFWLLVVYIAIIIPLY